MPRRSANGGSALETEIGFSRAVRIRDVIAVAGTAPIAPDGSTIGVGDLYAQTRACLDLSIAAIVSLGGSASDVLRTRIMLTNISQWKEAARAHGEVFADIKPACTFVGVKGFIRPEWLVETEMDALCATWSAAAPTGKRP